MRKIKQKIGITLLIVGIIQILLLVNMIPAQSYIIHQTDGLIENSKIEAEKENNIKGLINTGISLLIGFLSIKQIGIVSANNADDLHMECCPLTINGAICEDIVSEDTTSCAVNTLPYQTCGESTIGCRVGCCIDEEQGLCTEGSPEGRCESDGGRWESDKNCGIAECQKGCCILGNNAKFITNGQCEYQASVLGYEADYRGDIDNELECLLETETEEEGACVYESGNCNIKTGAECLSNNGEFWIDYLCSDPDVNSSCEKQDSIGCVDGEHEIYWFDSCKNKENIYSSDKDASWNNGEILSKEESCNYGNSNIDSTTCGNCDYLLGSTCSESKSGDAKIQDGDYFCKSLKCDWEGEEKENGETWCVYDNAIGMQPSPFGVGHIGSDPVGSRHWVASCIDGEVELDGCQDYRGEICTQSEVNDAGYVFTMAECNMNEVSLCERHNPLLKQEGEEEDVRLVDIPGNIKDCEEDAYCFVKEINVDENFYFKMCVGKYPRGLDSKIKANAQICEMTSIPCTVVYYTEWDGEEVVEANEGCLGAGFAQRMNDLCISKGDCGNYINYVGDGTNNIRITGEDAPSSGDASWKSYKKFKEPIPGLYANSTDIRITLERMGFSVNPDTGEMDPESVSDAFGGIAGATGAIAAASYGMGLLIGVEVGISTSAVGLVPASSLFGAVAAAAAGAIIGAYAGQMIAEWLEISGGAATAMVVGGAVLGAGVGIMIAQYMGIGLALGPVGWILALIGAIIIALTYLLKLFTGWGETREVDIEFSCKIWEAPTGGENCDLCDEDEQGKKCSQYRCESLGQACVLVNANTESPDCEAIPNNHTSPVVSSGEIYNYTYAFNNIIDNLQIDPTYSFVNEAEKYVELRESDGGCIQEYTDVLFTLRTEEYSQCKYSYQREYYSDFDEMNGEYPNGDNTYNLNHTFVFNMWSIHALEFVYNISGDLKEEFANTNLYVTCRDYWNNHIPAGREYVVNFCINSGPDQTAAWIKKYSPKDGTYIRYNQTEKPLKIYLNEPAECKYDKEKAKSYDNMAFTMDCKTGFDEADRYGWPCEANLTGLNNSENKFYIKCKDKPWVQTQEDIDYYLARNINLVDFEYTLIGSKSELQIDLISLTDGEGVTIEDGETLEAGFEPLSVDLEVETSEGALNGESECSYNFKGFEEEMIPFAKTYSNNHLQNFNSMPRGIKNIYIECEDEGGNFAYGNSTFNLVIDDSPPEIVRVYNEGNYLKIITNEEAKCYYDFDKCNFNMNNATSMTTGLSTGHKAEWITGKTYNIKCSDYWDNTNPTCAIKVTPNYFG